MYDPLKKRPRSVTQKLFKIGGPKCPVAAIIKLLSKRPEALISSGPLYLAPLNVKLRFIMMMFRVRNPGQICGYKRGVAWPKMNPFEHGAQIQNLAETAKRSALPVPHIPVFIYGKNVS